jgi:hypothetical protein
MLFHQKRTIEDGHTVSLYVLCCPDCGAKELNCIGTYHLPDVMPGTILMFIGHYLNLTVFLFERIKFMTTLRKK